MYKSEVTGKGGITARVVAKSCSSDNNKSIICTFELEYPRFIHSELMTHRLFSRNAMSSRAVPIQKMIDQVKNQPASPIHWGKNQPGMQADVEMKSGEGMWQKAAQSAALEATLLMQAGYHKQIVNRLLEPFQMMKTVLTATEFDNFFWLRCHKDAQPEIRELADCMWEAYREAETEKLKYGEYHVPYVGVNVTDCGIRAHHLEDSDGNVLQMLSDEEALKVSASCCAQVSYRILDNSLEKALMVYDKLVNSKPAHCYDEQTEVLTSDGFIKWSDVREDTLIGCVDKVTGKFTGYNRPKSLVKDYYEGVMYNYNQKDFNLSVTPGHNLYGKLVSKSEDRKSEDWGLFQAGTKSSSKSRYPTLGERSFINPLTTKGVSQEGSYEDYLEGQLEGFFVGDGFIPKDGSASVILFHLKKERKIEYITSILDQLNIEYTVKDKKGGTKIVRVKRDKIGSLYASSMYNGHSEKKLPNEFMYYPQKKLEGLYDGLKNSDGSIKRNTIVYSTTSKQLVREFEVLCAIGGFGSCHTYTNSKGGNSKDCYVTGVRTSKKAIVNDSRKPDDRVTLSNYKGFVYCANVEGNVLVVKRKGKVCLSGNSSPFEHQTTPMMEPEPEDTSNMSYGVTHVDNKGCAWSGNLKGFIQYRQTIPNNACWDYKED